MPDLSRCHLYGILDLGYVARDQVRTMAEALVRGGVDLLQLRAKAHSEEEIAFMAEEALEATRAAGVPLILNDFPRLAAKLGVEGVHVGQDDDAVEEARRWVGAEAIVGKSTHSLEQARAAATEPVDYIGFGPLYATPTKPQYRAIGLEDIAAVHEELSLPIFCIGGIKKENLAEVTARGARRVVIVSGILQSPDPVSYIAECRALLSAGGSGPPPSP